MSTFLPQVGARGATSNLVFGCAFSIPLLSCVADNKFECLSTLVDHRGVHRELHLLQERMSSATRARRHPQQVHLQWWSSWCWAQVVGRRSQLKVNGAMVKRASHSWVLEPCPALSHHVHLSPKTVVLRCNRARSAYRWFRRFVGSIRF